MRRIRVRQALGAVLAFLGVALLTASAQGAARLPSDPVGPYLLVDAETGRVLEDHDALRPWYPASTTKLMTIYVTFRAIRAGQLTLESPVLYSESAARQPPSKMAFKPGSTLSLTDALRIMMVKSANDIAVAVAEAVGGSVEGFAARMNAEAERLGMSRSHFVNPHGLPDERQVTSARDMALLARALLVEFPERREFYRIHAIQVGNKVLENFNPLIERYPGANGMKTGFICASGFNLIASARRGERELIAVVFGEYGGKQRAEHAAKLLEEGFRSTNPQPSTPGATLASVESGALYTAPLDMRPFVCEARPAAAASEADMSDDPEAPVEDVSYLGPPIDLGPPLRISVTPPPKIAKYGEAGFVARIPKPRPAQGSDAPRADVVDAFAPAAGSAVDPTASQRAIGAAAGGSASLIEVAPN